MSFNSSSSISSSSTAVEPGLSSVPLFILLLTPTVLVFCLIWGKHTDCRLVFTYLEPADPSCSCVQLWGESVGVQPHPSPPSSSWCGRCGPSAGCGPASRWAGLWWTGVWGAALCWVSGRDSSPDSSLWTTGTSSTWKHTHVHQKKLMKKKPAVIQCTSERISVLLILLLWIIYKYARLTHLSRCTLTTSLTWVWGRGCVGWGRGLSLGACHTALQSQISGVKHGWVRVHLFGYCAKHYHGI